MVWLVVGAAGAAFLAVVVAFRADYRSATRGWLLRCKNKRQRMIRQIILTRNERPKTPERENVKPQIKKKKPRRKAAGGSGAFRDDDSCGLMFEGKDAPNAC